MIRLNHLDKHSQDILIQSGAATIDPRASNFLHFPRFEVPFLMVACVKLLHNVWGLLPVYLESSPTLTVWKPNRTASPGFPQISWFHRSA